MPGSGEVIVDEHTKEFEAGDSHYFSSILGNGSVTHPCRFLKSTINSLAPCCQDANLFFVGGLIFVGDQTQDGGIICKLRDSIGTARGHTVMCEQGVHEGIEYAALRVRAQEVTHSHYLGSACQDVQDPDAQGGVNAQGLELGNELSGYNGVECQPVVYKQHSHLCVSLVQVGEGDGIVRRAIGVACKLKGGQGIRKDGADVESD